MHPNSKPNLVKKGNKIMKRKLTFTLAILIICSLLLASCGAAADFESVYVTNGKASRDDIVEMEKYDYVIEEAAPEAPSSNYYSQTTDSDYKLKENGLVTDNGTAPEFSSGTPVETVRMIIYRSSFDIQTKDYPASVEALKALCNKYEAYFESSNTYGNESTSRNSNYVIRVPVKNYSAFTGETGGIGVIVSSSEYNEDITDRYYDTEARLESARIREERVLKILENADKLDDVLALERELSDIRYEIESLTGSLRKYDSLVTYATVNLSIREVKSIVTPPQTVLTFGERVKVAFNRGLENLKNNFEDFVVDLSYNFVGVIIWIIIIVAVIIVIVSAKRKIKKRIASKKAEVKAEEPQEDK